MLLRENLGRCHQRTLKSVIHSHEQSHEGNQCLATSHISLKQPVHLFSGAHILADLAKHTFLSPRQIKRKHLGVECIEFFTDSFYHHTGNRSLAVAGISEDIELEVEELLKLQPFGASLKFVYVFWIMLGGHRLEKRGKAVTSHQRFGQRLLKRGHQRMLKEVHKRVAEPARRESAFFQSLRHTVDSLQPLGRPFGVIVVDFGMAHRIAVVENRRFSEKHILPADEVQLFELLDLAEPDDLHQTAAVGECADKTFLYPLALYAYVYEVSFDLDRGHLISREVGYPVEARTINMAMGIILKKIVKGVHVEVLGQLFCPSRSDTFQVLEVGIIDRLAFSSLHISLLSAFH